MSKWQPIETAPIQPFDVEHWYRSGGSVLVASGRNISIAWYDYTKNGKGRWRNFMGIVNPTHWQPLPDAPQ